MIVFIYEDERITPENVWIGIEREFWADYNMVLNSNFTTGKLPALVGELQGRIDQAPVSCLVGIV
jgi:hypothetical protein